MLSRTPDCSIQIAIADPRAVPAADAASIFQDRMAGGLQIFDGPVLLVLSGRDLTAKEFVDYGVSNPRWTGLLNRPNVSRHHMNEADHTFSSDRWRTELETLVLGWFRGSFSLVDE
jgi:hypothetical protein